MTTDLDPEALLDDIAAAQPQPLFLGMPETLDFRFDGHAGAGPSGAERWMNCTASLGAVREFLETLTPNQQHEFAGANTAARQGTTAHAAAETEVNVLLGTVSAEEAEQTLLELTIMPEVAEEAYDEEMAGYISEYVAFIQTYIDAGHEVRTEQRVEAVVPLTVSGAYAHTYEDGDTLPDYYVITGSADAVVLPTRTERVLTVVDLKYGNGIDVDVESNPQIRLYALGVLSDLADEHGNLPDLDRIDYVIVQPRLGGIKMWSESVDDLLTWRDEALSPALTSALGLDGNAVYAPSELACQWCPVRGSCPALTQERMDNAASVFEAVTEAEFENGLGSLPEAGALSDDLLGDMLAKVESLVALKDDLRAEAQRRLYRGQRVPGYQLVSYTPPRKWTDEALSDETLAALPVWKDPTLLTPTQAVKALGEQADQVAQFIYAPPKKPVIARVGDRRKTWEGRAPEDMFTVHTDADVSGNEGSS